MNKPFQSYDCYMGSQSVTCHPTQVNAARAPPNPRQSRQAGTRLTYSGGMEGWVDLGVWERTEMVW